MRNEDRNKFDNFLWSESCFTKNEKLMNTGGIVEFSIPWEPEISLEFCLPFGNHNPNKDQGLKIIDSSILIAAFSCLKTLDTSEVTEIKKMEPIKCEYSIKYADKILRSIITICVYLQYNDVSQHRSLIATHRLACNLGLIVRAVAAPPNFKLI